jgi:DNA-directed RNA polymerase specialized sigma24 family protein/ketosteroid isomerase-like protein
MSHDPAEPPGEKATRDFAGHRELLFSVVYGMLGSVSGTEDVLRDTWLTWAHGGGRPPAGADGNPRAHLLRIAVARALARQTARVPTSVHVALGTLPPLERAAFVLNEVFGYADADVAAILGRPPDAVRQLAHRARAHVRARRPPRPAVVADPRPHQELTERFIAAATSGDLPVLLDLLAPDVTLWTDGRGRERPALRPVAGRERVARFLRGYAARHPARHPARQRDVHHRYVGGDPSAVVFPAGSPYAVLVMDLSAAGDRITGICLVTSPGTLSRPPQ